MAKKRRYTNLYVKRRLVQLEVDVFGSIANGILTRKSRYSVLTQVKKQLLDVAVQVGLDQKEADRLWAIFSSNYSTIAKGSALAIKKATDNDQKRAAIYTAIRPQIIQNRFLADAEQVTRMYEQRMKKNELDELLEASSDSPFYLCSSHEKPAKDHAEWQGRVYYDENWESNGSYSDQEKISIRAYIRNHKLRSVQWVTGPPVYMIFRPNCKHYLRPMPLREVLRSSSRSLLKKHGMIREDPPATEQRLNYRIYYNRLKVEEELNQYVPCEQLKKDMQRDKKLIDKWH